MICPKCGMEFVDGVTHCSDCHVPLVTPSEVKKEMIPFMEGSVTTMQRLTDFLIYSGIDAKMEETDITDTNMAEDTENMTPVNICVLWIPKEEEKQAQKLATVFFHEEEKRNPMSISQESIKDMKSNKATASKEEQGTYILGKDRHADSISTFWMLAAAALVCTGISLNNTITNFSKIISLEYNSYVPFVVFWIISILLIWGTLKYYKITKDLKAKIDIEYQWHKRVSTWLNDSFTANSIDKKLRELYGDVQEEVLILNRYHYLKKQATCLFPDIPVGFLDLEIDSFYENIFKD